ncbi:MAG: D-alanyl-D-alanine carboxypeptidase/D-alanyl-D-alanine-endopeptidase [Planctomycetes bacterium]|nr:D-alanyl-D-alanine carboxypeptidase/D-alanyl-D-alanine-endopeptidase [Planctomycetota bacterium]
MRRMVVILSFFAVLSCSIVPAPATPAKTLEELLKEQVQRSGARQSLVGVAVLGNTGRALALLNADRPLKPASNMKILTTVTGLELLGADHQYSTRIIARGELAKGKISGDVIVRGTGDPNISGRFHDGDPLFLFRQWAKKLKQAGLNEISGNLVADDSYFDQVRFLPGWNPKDRAKWYSAQVSPLSLNDNCIEIRVVPGSVGKSARVELSPASSFVTSSGAPSTVSGKKVTVIASRSIEGNKIVMKGRIGSSAGAWAGSLAIDDPALFFVHTLAAVLKKEGIKLGGDIVRMGAADVPGGGSDAARTVSTGERILVEHNSRLKDDIPVINKKSQNLHAELLLKATGRKIAGEGSVAGGGRAVSKAFAGFGVKTKGLVVADGSGLSHDNRVTARQIVSLLHGVRSKDYYKVFKESLPVAGIDGTLKKRFASRKTLVGKVFAKTGYISGVSALSGYVQKGKTVWSFSILCNSFPAKSLSRAKKLQEDIVNILYSSMP